MIFWNYARARWNDSSVRVSDESFAELMQMIGQEYAVIQPSEKADS